MNDYKQQIIDRGYKVVAETEDGISFVNEKVQTCVMLLFKYNQLSNHDKDRGHDLHKTLIDKYSYANKGTICVIVDYEGDCETDEFGDERPCMYYASGMHHVNRIGYFVTKEPITFDFEVEID